MKRTRKYEYDPTISEPRTGYKELKVNGLFGAIPERKIALSGPFKFYSDNIF